MICFVYFRLIVFDCVLLFLYSDTLNFYECFVLLLWWCPIRNLHDCLCFFCWVLFRRNFLAVALFLFFLTESEMVPFTTS